MKKVFSMILCFAMLFCTLGTAFAQAGDPVTVTFEMHVGNPEAQAPQIYAAAQAFMAQNPDVKIVLNGNTDIGSKIKLLAQSDTLPDAFWTYVDDAKQYIAQGMLADLSDPLSQDSEWVNGFLPGAYGANLSDEGVYGISCEMQVNCWWVNTALFAKCGLEAPKTFDDLIAAAPVLKENGIIPLSIGTSATLGLSWCLTDSLWYYGIGDMLPALRSGEISWNNEKIVSYFSNWEKAYQAGVFPEDIATLDYFKARELFLTGQAAVFSSGIWDCPMMEATEYAKDIQLWWGPTFTDAPVTTQYQFISAGYPYCVSAKLKTDEPEKYDALCRFFKFYYGAEGTKLVADTGCVPTTNYPVEVDAEKTPVFAQALAEIAKADQIAPMNAEMLLGNSTVAAICNSVSGIMNGLYSAQDAAAMLETEMAIINLQ